MANVKSIEEYLKSTLEDSAAEKLSKLFPEIEIAAIHIQEQLAHAAINDNITGAAGQENIQGEAQQKLDVYADELFIKAFAQSKVVCGVASEERDDYLDAKDGLNPDGDYIITMDPLDGSSNIDVNVPVGTIISIYKRLSPKGNCTSEDFLQAGKEQVGALYILYGAACLLVVSFGDGTSVFALNQSLHQFQLTESRLKAPDTGKIYSINEGNGKSFDARISNYIDYCQSSNNDQGKAYSGRYIGSLVADFHRNLIKGGLYIYPGTESNPRGKLRLLYEANPLAFIAKNANADASDGEQDILEIKPKELHERCPLFIGSKSMLKTALSL